MATTSMEVEALRGGEWLLKAGDPGQVFRPERLSEEQRLIAQTVSDFVSAEVLPAVPRLEAKDWELARRLIRRCGELGLLGIDTPEEYGGVGLDKVSSLVVSEHISTNASFGAAYGAQSNLTALPLVLFGTEAQKRKYLPRIVAGELVGSYCLSEPGSGSDALGAKTRATPQPDGSFVLSGEKAWITNGGFADLYIVFAKVDGDKFSAFLVERGFPGLSTGKEEHKMGLHGSSTVPVILQDVPVPAENLLGEVGKGHKIAFNVLNFARFKLGAMCLGGSRRAIGEAARYAAERRQFGVPIASFGAIKHKIGDMVARTYAVESLLHRTAGMIDQRIAAAAPSPTDPSAALAAFEEYAIEASIAKVAGSELCDYVLDENIQIHGGNGFVSDYPAERHYRDSRVNRIFEGTNEINRLLIPGLLARRAAKGEIGVIAAAKALQDELLGPPAFTGHDDQPFAEERRIVESCRKASLMVLGLGMQTYREGLGEQQEVLLHLADMLIDTYASDSALLRAMAVAGQQEPRADWHAAAARVFLNEAALRVDAAARLALASMTDGDTLRTMMAAQRRLFKQLPVNATALRRTLADATVERGGWIF